jgi:hypothetical protein
MPPKKAEFKKTESKKKEIFSRSDIAGMKTCADKIKKDNVDKVAKKIETKKTDAKKIDTKKPKPGKKGGAPTLRAAFLKGKILAANTILKCGFMSLPPPDYVRTSTSYLKSLVDKNGVTIPLDPLQLEVDKMEVIPAIIYTIQTRLQPIINIKFKFYENEEEKTLFNPAVCDVRISFNPRKGAWSLIGKDILDEKNKEVPTMNLGWFDVPTTLHEFCHAVGMIHEHQNPLGKPINWNVEAVREWAFKSQGWDEETTNTNIINKYKKDQINGSEYDPLSLMLYFFPGILVNNDEGECCGSGTQQNCQFSPFDVLFLNKIYPLNDQNVQPPEFTVKFFNDNFNQQVDIDKLKDQIKKNSQEGYLFYEGIDGTEGEITDSEMTPSVTSVSDVITPPTATSVSDLITPPPVTSVSDLTTPPTVTSVSDVITPPPVTSVSESNSTTPPPATSVSDLTTPPNVTSVSGSNSTTPPSSSKSDHKSCKTEEDTLNSCLKTKGKITECKAEQDKFSSCKKDQLPVHQSLKCTATEVIMMDFPLSAKNNCGCGTDDLLDRNNNNNEKETKQKNKNNTDYRKKVILFITLILFFMLLFIMFNYIYSSNPESGPEPEKV